jgi:sensor c-di-GMP phosphodiesterase-like protein
MRLAMRNDEFEAHYQPTIDTATRRCAGAEVLIRWRHPDRGYVRPDLFIAMAEEGGLIEPMTEALMRRVVAEQADLFREYPQLHVGVNLAPEHFSSVMLLDKIPRIFSEASIPPNRLILEATERSLIKDTSATPTAVMQALRDMGATIALDDFGTGYSSLSYLHKFKFDYLKIDASFVRRIGTDNVSAGLIDSIIDLGKRLNVRLIAEGVETEQQFTYLASRGVHYVQGWLFAKALPPDEFRAYVKAHPPIKL